MNVKNMAIGFGASLLLQACILGGGGTGGEGLTGTLVDSRGAPVAGAKVGVYSKTSSAGAATDSAITDAHGGFEFPRLKKGRYNLAASAQRQDTVLAAFVRDITVGKARDLGDNVLRPAGNLQVGVRTAGGVPVSGAQCIVAASPYAAVSDTAGTCLLEDMAPGSYQVGIIGGGDTTLTDSLEVLSSVTNGLATFVITSGPGLGGRWSPRVSGTRADLFSVIWAGTQYAAVGDSGIVLQSPDGVNWSKSGVQSPHSKLTGVAWTGRQLVAVGRDRQDSGEIFTSTTGAVWTRRAKLPQGLNAVAWIQPQGKLLAVGDSGSMRISSDGMNWSAGASGTVMGLSSVAWTDSLIVVVGSGPVTNGSIPGIVLTSPDLGTWTTQRGGIQDFANPAFISSLSHCTWTGSEFVAVGGYGDAWSSGDGRIWTSWIGGAPLLATAWTGTRLVAVGFYSVDNSAGIWTLESNNRTNRYAGGPSYVYPRSITLRPGLQLVVVGDKGMILASP